MHHSVTYVASDNFILLDIKGAIHLPDVRQMFSEGARFIIKHDCFRTLSDYSEAHLNLSTFELYNLATIFSDEMSAAGIETSRVKRAILVASDIDDFLFFETSARNRGHQVKLFRDADKARQWLLET